MTFGRLTARLTVIIISCAAKAGIMRCKRRLLAVYIAYTGHFSVFNIGIPAMIVKELTTQNEKDFYGRF